LVSKIAQASDEQSSGIGQITQAVAQMDTVTQSNAAAAEECASASEELNAQAESLNEAVSEMRRLVSGPGVTGSETTKGPRNRVSPEPQTRYTTLSGGGEASLRPGLSAQDEALAQNGKDFKSF
jgi:methyl-accepting chemotaxis protein